MKKLSVIIPCFKEDPSRAINSIKNQLYYDPRDVEIILCMDDPNTNYTFENVITIQTDVNTGPGLARQRGLDVATGEYFTFIDSDNMWYNALGYAIFLKDMYWRNTDQIDLMKVGILEQYADTHFKFIENDLTWCFGKVYRTEFIRQNNIRFHPELRIHEDSYFVRVANLYDPITLVHQDAVYLWTDNPKSIVRVNNGEYWKTGFPEYIRMTGLVIDERNRLGVGYDGLEDICFMYLTVSRIHENQLFTECIQAIKQINHNYMQYFNKLTQMSICINEITRTQDFREYLPKYTLEEFKELIKK